MHVMDSFVNKAFVYVLSRAVGLKHRESTQMINGIESNPVCDYNIFAPPVQSLLTRQGSAISATIPASLEKNKPYIFMSNHRNILFDPIAVDYALITNGFRPAVPIMGVNLTKVDGVLGFVSKPLRDSFSYLDTIVIPRGNPTKSDIRAYYANVNKTLESKSVWIAQRKGRSKDATDVTDEAVYHAMTSRFLTRVPIIPVAISYEFEPQIHRFFRYTRSGYKKRALDDIIDMYIGIRGFKGSIHVAFGEPAIDAQQVTDQIHQLTKIHRVNEESFAAVQKEHSVVDSRLAYQNRMTHGFATEFYAKACSQKKVNPV